MNIDDFLLNFATDFSDWYLKRFGLKNDFRF